MHDNLVILCLNAPEALKAAAALPATRELRRFFVFLADRPEATDELEAALASKGDGYMCAKRAVDWADSVAHVAARLAFLYAKGMNCLFCTAANLPSPVEVDEAHKALETATSVQRPLVWGMTREHAVIYGFGEAPQPQTAKTAALPYLNAEVSPIELAQAMAGVACSPSAVVAAVQEIVPLGSMSLHTSLSSHDEKYAALLNAVAERAEEIDDDWPLTVLMGSAASEREFESALAEIPRGGALVVATGGKQPFLYSTPPYRRFRCAEGYEVFVYGAKREDKSITAP
jgi:hypothetical protein